MWCTVKNLHNSNSQEGKILPTGTEWNKISEKFEDTSYCDSTFMSALNVIHREKKWYLITVVFLSRYFLLEILHLHNTTLLWQTRSRSFPGPACFKPWEWKICQLTLTWESLVSYRGRNSSLKFKATVIETRQSRASATRILMVSWSKTNYAFYNYRMVGCLWGQTTSSPSFICARSRDSASILAVFICNRCK